MKAKILICAAACLFISGMLLAEDGQNKGEGKGQKRDGQGQGQGDRGREEIKARCPECEPLAEQLKAKREEMKALMEREKTLREAGREKREQEELAKLEELKKTDPKKYEEKLKKMEERKKEMEGKKEEKKEERKEGRKDGDKRDGQGGGKDGRPGPSAEQLEKMKKENPDLFNLMTEREAKMKEMRALHEQFRECEQKNKKGDKEGKENK